MNEMTFSSVVAAPTVLCAATATTVHNLCRSLKVTSRVINVTLDAVFCHMVLDNTSAERTLRRSTNRWGRIQFADTVVTVYARCCRWPR